MTRARPILFSGPMVKAILAGRKTQTRRAVKGEFRQYEEGWSLDGNAPRLLREDWCPYGAPADRLWVRETWGYRGSHWCSNTPQWSDHTIEYLADGSKREIRRPNTDRSGIPKQRCRCKGEGDEFDRHMEHSEELDRYWASWRPSIFLPRWASRITLEITDVRVERLQDISHADAMAEGFDYGVHGTDDEPRAQFGSLWEKLNGKREGCGWHSNPWLWVLSFRRLA